MLYPYNRQSRYHNEASVYVATPQAGLCPRPMSDHKAGKSKASTNDSAVRGMDEHDEGGAREQPSDPI